MSEFKGTPGPWYVEEGTNLIFAKDVYSDEPGGSFVVAQARGWGVLRILGDKKAEAIQDANARVFAAALDLLEACQYAFDRLSERPLTCHTHEERLEELEDWIDDDILPMLGLAIAKAKGE